MPQYSTLVRMNQTAATVEELTDLAVIVGSTTRRVDPDAIADSDVDAVMTSLAKCKRLIDGATTLMARRVSESGCHKKAGHRSAEEYLAKASGTSKGRAKDQLSTSNKIQDQPETQKAVTEGELSADQAAIVADAVNADPDAAEELLDSARDDSLVGLRKKARNVKFDADPTPDRTRTRHHHRRGFRSWTESDGEWRASLSGPADVGARIEAALRGAHDRIFKAAHASGRREDAACYLFDAMVATLEHGAYRPTAPGSTASSRSRQRGQDHEPHPNPRSEQVASSDPKGDGRADNNAQGGTHPDTGSPTDCNDPASRPDDTARQGDSESSDYPNGPRDAAGQANTDGPCNASGPGDGDGQTDAEDVPAGRAPDGAPGSQPDDRGQARRQGSDLAANAGRPQGAEPSTRDEGGQPDVDDAWQPYLDGVAGVAHGRQTKVIIHVDGAALVRGRLHDGERCWIDGVGDVPLAVAKEQIASAHLAYVIRDAVDIRTVVHLGRQATAHQHTALQARGYCCEVPGCASDHLLEIDHITGWTFNHQTAIVDLAWLCPYHHRKKSAGSHRLTGPPGNRKWITDLDVVLAEDQPSDHKTSVPQTESRPVGSAANPPRTTASPRPLTDETRTDKTPTSQTHDGAATTVRQPSLL